MSALRVDIEGFGAWPPESAEGGVPPGDAGRPAARLLPPTERRRAPASVLLAVEVAAQAVAMSGRPADSLACVFASAYGDIGITDYLCATLAQAPDTLSPTRFHHSVHNAPAGYWTIATGCRAPSSAVCAGGASAGAGLLEASVLALAEQRPVLLVCSDVAGNGPLGEIVGCRSSLGCALVLAPPGSGRAMARLDLALSAAAPPAAGPDPAAGNPSAAALRLLALLTGQGGDAILAAGDRLALHVHMEKPE